MKETGILMTPENIQATIEGRKSMTRRVIKPQPPDDCGHIRVELFHPTKVNRKGEEYPGDEIFGAYSDDGEWGCKCPYTVGDRLWVRETWDYTGQGLDCVYKADAKPTDIFPWEKYRPSIFMPRWASRITLEIVEIKVEKLQDISEADAIAEGLESLTRPNGKTLYSAPQCGDRPPYWESSASEAFMWLWDSINAKRGYSWESNTWCWCLSFKRLNNG